MDPVDPEPPPDEGEQAPEVTTTSDAGRENLAPSQTNASPDVSTDGRATTTVSPGRRPHLTIKTGESEATSASGVPTGDATDRHLDDRDVATPHKKTRVDTSTGHPPSRSPTTPTSGRVVSESRPATPSHTPATPPLTAADFYLNMTAIMAQFSETISAKFGQSIDDNREATRESTMLIREEIRAMSSSISADAKSHRDELSKSLNGLGRFIAREVAAAIATTSEKANSLNEASLQTIVDLLQNRSNVQPGDHSTSPATSSRPSPDFGLSASNEAQPAQGEPKRAPIIVFADDETEPEDPPPIVDLEMEGRDHLGSEPSRRAARTPSARFASTTSETRQPRETTAGFDWEALSSRHRESSATTAGAAANTAKPTETPSGFDWRQLSPANRASSLPPAGTTASADRYGDFRYRIRRGITNAVRRVIEREPSSSTPNTFVKSVASVISIPTYGGDDDLEVFMKWLQGFLTFIDIHQLVGFENDYNRILTIGSALEGRALSWYNLTMRGPLSGPKLSFLDTVIYLSDEFLTPAAATKAQQSWEKVQYSPTLGIRAFVRELQTLSNHVFMPIDEYTLRRQVIAAIPQTICNWLINYKDLSTSTSSVVEWVDAIERRERELLEREAYNVIVSTTKGTTLGSTRNRDTYGASSARTTTKATTRAVGTTRTYLPSGAKSQAESGTTPTTSTTNRSSDRRVPTGNFVPTKQRVPLADITCHACGQKGHYRGSKECPNTPSSARLHAMGAETDAGNTATANDNIAEEDNFDGDEYDDDVGDFGPAEVETESDDVGTGAIIASIHVDDVQNDDDLVVHVAAMATSRPSDDVTVAHTLMQSVREDYELRGSGVKPRTIGRTNKQIQANSTKEWASNSNVKPVHPGQGGKTHVQRQGLTALVKVNGIEAYTCWDSGSELDAISPDFTRATGVEPAAKKSALRIRLGTKGSSATTSYEVSPTLDFGNTKFTHDLDVVNLDRWDLLLGSPFCNKHGVVLNYNDRTIRFGDTVINALSREEEATARRDERQKRLHAFSE